MAVEPCGIEFRGRAAAVEGAEAEEARQLKEAVDSREIIGQAKWILMEYHMITAEQAFLVLAQASSRTQSTLRTVVDHLVATGELAGGDQSPRI